ncbi:hypothetical protein ACHQM5_004087 [Ranunculus cassubicifolius]
MAKSQRSKREKRLRTIRREISTPHYDTQEAGKLAAQELALAAPKLTPKVYKTSMEITSNPSSNTMEIDMENGVTSASLKPVGTIGKKMKKKLKIGKRRHGKNGKIRKKSV